MKTKAKIFFAFTLAFMTSFFVFCPKSALADSYDLLISAVQNGKEKAEDDWVKICNVTGEKVDLKSYRLIKNDDVEKGQLKSWSKSSDFVANNAVFTWSNDDITSSVKSLSLQKKDANNEYITIEKVSFDKCPNDQKYCAFSFHDDIKTCHEEEEEEENTSSDSSLEVGLGDIIFSEILPHPKKDEPEFIEFYNPSKRDIDLTDWTIRDASKTGKFVFSAGRKIKSQSYLIIKRPGDFSFALNDSGLETLSLFDKNQHLMATVSYVSSHEGSSYAYSQNGWRWSPIVTPGENNQFSQEIKWSVKVPSQSSTKIKTPFKIKVAKKDKKKIKITWDFGDKHKSYLANTTHAFDKPGIFIVKVKIWDGSQEIIQEYAVEIKKPSHPEVVIIALSPNPKGLDKKQEWIKIKNNSNRKVNLKNWYIATQSKKNIYRHLIKDDLIIKPGEEKVITAKYAAFSLNNTQGNVSLLYPDSKKASQIKYQVPKDSKEGAILEKKDKSWTWALSSNEETLTDNQAVKENEPINSSSPEINPALINSAEENNSYEPTKDAEEVINSQEIENSSLTLSIQSKSFPKVLGASTKRTPIELDHRSLLNFWLDGTSFKHSFSIVFFH